MMWGLMGAVLVGLIGITVDFTRAQALRNQMQNAVDGAALVAERSSNLTHGAAHSRGAGVLRRRNGRHGGDATFTCAQTGGRRPPVDAWMPMPLSLARIIKNRDWDIAVHAVGRSQRQPADRSRARARQHRLDVERHGRACATPRPISPPICFRSMATPCAWRWCRSWRR